MAKKQKTFYLSMFQNLYFLTFTWVTEFNLYLHFYQSTFFLLK